MEKINYPHLVRITLITKHAIVVEYIHVASCDNKHSPLLLPSGPRRMVHSSIEPKVVNSCRTSSSVCCLLNIPTNSFLSAGSTDGALRNRGNREKKERTTLVSSVCGPSALLGVKREDILRLTPRTTKLHGYTSIHHPKGRKIGIYIYKHTHIYIFIYIYIYVCIYVYTYI